MLRLEAVSRRYPNGTEALAGVTLDFPRGSFTALLGPSGCGKSTLLRLIAGLDAPDGGTLHWAEGRPGPGQIGMVFQDPVLLPWASTADNAALGLVLRGQSKAAARAAVAGRLAALGLAPFAEAAPRQLSGGMRMRVALARALSTDPRLLLLDEPFAALDEPTRHRLQAELRDLHAAGGMTVVLVTHSLYEAAFCAGRIAVLSGRPGRLAALVEPAPHAGRDDPAYHATVAAIGRLMPEAA